MRSEFEEYYSKKYPNDQCTLIRNGNYSGWLKQQLWEQWQHQQTKVDELQTLLSLQRDRNKALENELTSSRNYGDELQKRMNEIIQQSKDFIRSCKNDAEIFEDTSAAGKAYGAEAVVELLEQALKGGEE